MKQKYDVRGMSCAACSQAVERAVNKLDGVKSAEVSLMTNSMQVVYDEAKLDASEIMAAVSAAGYAADVAGEKAGRQDAAPDDEQRSVKWRLIVSFCCLAPLMVLSMGPMLGMPLPYALQNPMVMALSQLLLCLPVAIANSKYFRNGFKALWHRSPNMDSLIAVGSGAALVYGVWTMFNIALAMGEGAHEMAMHHAMELYFESAATILTLITLGKYFEARSKGKTQDAIRKLLDLAPKTAIVERDGQQTVLPIEQVVISDVVIIKPGASVPVDGVVLSGAGAVDESALTGESMPVDKQPGDRVSQGTINKQGALRVRVDRATEDTVLSQIVRLVEEAGASKAPIGRLADKISGVFVPVVIAIALLATAVWLITGQGVPFALSIGISVLVISCPCALGLATPVAIMVGTGRAASLGMLFKSAEALETAHAIRAVVLDKTGTITEGRPAVTEVIPADGLDARALLELAVSLEKPSEHPLAQAVLSRAGAEGAEARPIEDFEAVPGRGVSARLDGALCCAGNRQMMNERGIDLGALGAEAERLMAAGNTCLFFARDGHAVGLIAVADTIKPDSARAISEFKRMGIRPVMLTGDNKLAAAAVAGQLGIDEYVAEVLPQDKEREVRRLQDEGLKVAMVGDGINDAPALARADLGMAIGAGTDIAIESAGVVLMKNSLMDAVDALRLGRAVIRNIKQNLFWAFFYNTIGIPLAAGVFYTALGWKLNPMIGAAAMSLSSVCVVTNALRLRGFKGSEREPSSNDDEGDEYIRTIQIEGMTCQNCVRHVQEALEGIPGVHAEVILAEGIAKVRAPEGVTDDQLKRAVEDADYKVIEIR